MPKPVQEPRHRTHLSNERPRGVAYGQVDAPNDWSRGRFAVFRLEQSSCGSMYQVRCQDVIRYGFVMTSQIKAGLAFTMGRAYNLRLIGSPASSRSPWRMSELIIAP